MKEKSDLERLTLLLDDFGLKYTLNEVTIPDKHAKYTEVGLTYSRMWLVFMFEGGNFKYMCMER